MTRPRARNVAALSLIGVSLLGLAVHLSGSGGQESAHVVNPRGLANIAKDRFENDRGLSPCDGYAWEVVRAARGRLASVGDSDAEVLAVVEPAFSEIELVAFGPDYVRSYRFPGQTGLSFLTVDSFSPAPDKLSDLPLTGVEQLAITSPLDRHIRYAMTARELGRDGVSYFLGAGEDSCAYAWMPRGPGPGGLIAEMIAEASKSRPSKGRLLQVAKAIDDADAAH